MDNPNDRFGAATYVRRDCAYTLPGMAKKRTMVARRAVLIAAPLAGLFALGGRGFGQEFPTGPITFVVAFPPGGSIDLVMRAMAPKLQERLGKPVFHPSVPAKSVSELIALLKQKPGEITFGHSGAGAAIFLAAELFQSMTATKMNGVSYRGAPPALNDVMAGHVALMFADAGSVVGHINAGRVRALGVSSTARVPALPDVPTIAESGVPGFDAVGWTMICAPSATPKPVIDRLHAELKAVAATPEVRDVIVGSAPSRSTARRRPSCRNSWRRRSTAGAASFSARASREPNRPGGLGNPIRTKDGLQA